MSIRPELVLWLGIGVVFAKFRIPENAPVQRLATTLEAFVKANPGDATGHYNLARLHYLAYALRTDTASYFPSDEGPPRIANRFHPGKAQPSSGTASPKIGNGEALAHLRAASVEIREAMRLEASNPLHALTAACIWEDGANDAAMVEKNATRAVWMGRAVEEYKRAFDLSIRKDILLKRQPIAGIQSLVSWEAVHSWLRMVDASGAPAAEVARVREQVSKLDSLPRGGITPVIFTLESGRQSLDSLVNREARVPFDLDGTGRAQTWNWVNPSASILVWDPARTGAITSGRQLFGSVTWWMFWEDGYQALAALDANGDGWLTGAELDGLAIWNDRNQNGLSDPGEVVPIEQTAIAAIRVRADFRDGESLASLDGIRLLDGSTRPTWDWVATPVHATMSRDAWTPTTH